MSEQQQPEPFDREQPTSEPLDSAPFVMADEQVVPVRRQYLQIKQRFPGTILLFRLGDFYETFDDDAVLASRLLDITLTSREMGKNLRVPLAGIPHHAAQAYIARLVAAGHKVAICEQTGQATKGKGLIERGVTRVVTPGTVVDPEMLDAHRNSFIAALVGDRNRAGMAYADITTGEFATTEFQTTDEASLRLAIGRELQRLHVAELVQPRGQLLLDASGIEHLSTSEVEAWRTREDRTREILERHFDVGSLDGFGCSGKPFAIRAAGTLLAYLEDTRQSAVPRFAALMTYDIHHYMTLDGRTRRNLELTESSTGDKQFGLIAVLDHTETAMGARLLRRWLGQPLIDPVPINERLDRVTWFVDHPAIRSSLQRSLKQVGDIERLTSRAVAGSASPRDLMQLCRSLAELPEIVSLLGDNAGAPELQSRATVCSELHGLLSRSIVDDPPVSLAKGGVIRPGFAAELDGHLASARDAQTWIANLERTERERTGIRSLKVGYNRVFGYYLEITAAALITAAKETDKSPDEVLPAHYIAKQSLSTATRYFTPELKEYETRVLHARETLADLEQGLFHQVTHQIAGKAPELLATAAAIATLDAFASLATAASLHGYVRPRVDDSRIIEIHGGRHPSLEVSLGPGVFVPNDTVLDCEGEQIVILTGPNMAGKSSWLRQSALIVLMAQAGSYVPATAARIGLVDRIFTRIGAQDDIATGQSTFMVEMLETANILHHASPRSLLILDEIGRGTSTFDGLAIARAIVEHLHNSPDLGCRTLFATHYHELTELARVLPRVRCARMDVKEDGESVVFLHRVVAGGAGRSYGIHVARLAGIPRAVVRRARDILADLEGGASALPVDTRRKAMGNPAPETPIQLTLFAPPHPVIEALRELDVEALSPLEAITELFALKQLTKTD